MKLRELVSALDIQFPGRVKKFLASKDVPRCDDEEIKVSVEMGDLYKILFLNFSTKSLKFNGDAFLYMEQPYDLETVLQFLLTLDLDFEYKGVT